MNNLLDNANKINRNILLRQIAEMEVYRIPQYISMLISNICFYIMKFLGGCIKWCKTKADSMEKLTFESQLNKAEIYVQRNNAYEDNLQKNIRYHVKNSLFCVISKKASGDEVSVKVIKSASNIVSKKDLVGKSVYEENDSIYRKYADKKRCGYQEYLIIWLCIAISIVIVGVTALIFKHYPLKYIFGMVVISELVDYILVARILGIWHMARLVWIITSEMGSGSSEIYDYPVSSLKTDELHSIDLRMRTLHSLIYSANVLSQEKRTLENEIESYKKQIQKNIEIISSIKNQRTDEKERIIYSKQDENVHLRNVIDEDIKKIEDKKKEYENTTSLISALKEWLIPIFREKWNGSYNHLQVSENALDNVVCLFSMGDVMGIEKRFYEIDNTSKPQAIAKKKSGMYGLELLTVQGGVANITFGDTDKNGYVCIKNVFREEKLIEPFVTNDELAEAIRGLVTNESNDGEYKKQINKLSDEINEKTEECIKLKNLINKFKCEGDIEQAEKNGKELELYKQQLVELQNEYNKRLNEIEGLYVQISTLNENQEEIRQELELKKKELCKAKENVTRCNSIIEQKEIEIASLSDKIQNSDNQIVTLNGLLKKAEITSGADQETIRKLRNSKKNLEEDNKRFATEIKDKNTEMDNLCLEKEKVERIIETQKSDIKKLQQEIESNSSKILYNEEIYEELYAWIQAAQKYVYIISPFIKYHQFTVIKRKLKDATCSNPDLKIRILYGMKDTNSKGQLQNPDGIVEAREFMKQLQELLGNALQVKETNTHDKVIIVDDKKFMLGSANVMSFTGDYVKKKGLHSEIVICSKNRKQLMELKSKFFDW